MTNSSNISPISIKVIKYPIITEKSTTPLQNNKYSFIVDRNSDKITIKSEIEYLFNVKVIKVNTCRLPRKKKRVKKSIGWKPQYKKAIITLATNDIIDLFKDIK